MVSLIIFHYKEYSWVRNDREEKGQNYIHVKYTVKLDTSPHELEVTTANLLQILAK